MSHGELPRFEWDHLQFRDVMEHLDELNFILVQRNALSAMEAEKLVRACQKKHIRLIFEIDDDLTIGNRLSQDQTDAVKILLSGSDTVITSTHYLRSNLFCYNHDVRVIENRLSAFRWLNKLEFMAPRFELSRSGINILYMGTFSHTGDLDLIRPALAAINAEGMKATVYTIGIGHGIESDDIKAIPIPDGWSLYPKFVAWLRTNANNFDFGIAPLEENEFNKCKSGLKYLDYAALHLPGIFSKGESYNTLVKHETTGLLVHNNPKRWIEALRRLCTNVDFRKKLAFNAYHDLIHHHIINRHDLMKFSEALGFSHGQYSYSYLNGHPLLNEHEFDPHWYFHQYTAFLSGSREEKAWSSVKLAEHYLNEGAARGFDPGPLFSTNGYLDRYKDVANARVNPLIHYLRNGKNEGRQPKPSPRTIAKHKRPDALGPVSTLLPLGKGYKITQKKIALHLHVYHLNLVDEMIDYLLNIRQKFTLFVSAPVNFVKQLEAVFPSRLPLADVCIKGVENRGRDVAPWVVTFRNEISGYDLFCHIHTKSTLHTEGHANWRKHLLHETLGSPASISNILDKLDTPDIGLIMPAYFSQVSYQPKWGNNQDYCNRLLSEIGYNGDALWCRDFPAGSFFWARTELLQPLFDLHLSLDDFEIEKGQNDGTLAHTIERIIGFLPAITGLQAIFTAAEERFN